ncbi:MAG: EI24 domain-containing protein, partial [Erythrobacteraceae bacterium]
MIAEVLAAFAKAFGQLADRRVIAVLAKSVGVTLVLFAAAGAGLYLALSRLIESYGYDGEWAGLAAAVLVPVAMWLLFRVVALAVLQFFADEIVAAVEAR